MGEAKNIYFTCLNSHGDRRKRAKEKKGHNIAKEQE